MDTAVQAQVVQAALRVLDVYVQRFQPNWTSSLLFQVVRLILEKLLDPALAEADAQQFAERVIAAYHLQDTSGMSRKQSEMILPPEASVISPHDADLIAAQVADEITQFRAKQAAAVGQVDVSQPQVGDLSLSSAMQQTPMTSGRSATTAAVIPAFKDESDSESPEADRSHP